MTRNNNARLAGFAFLFYIGAGIASLVLANAAIGGGDTATRLSRIAAHTTDLRWVVLLSLLTSFAALVLGVTLHALTREQDPELALLGLVCRVIEGMPGVSSTLALLWLTGASDAPSLDGAAGQALGAYLLRGGGGTGAIFFAVASTLFAWLLLRGRMVPAALAWLGVLASALLVLVLPLDLAGLWGPGLGWSASITWLVWLPMLIYELTLAMWLIAKGAAVPLPPDAVGERAATA